MSKSFEGPFCVVPASPDVSRESVVEWVRALRGEGVEVDTSWASRTMQVMCDECAATDSSSERAVGDRLLADFRRGQYVAGVVAVNSAMEADHMVSRVVVEMLYHTWKSGYPSALSHGMPAQQGRLDPSDLLRYNLRLMQVGGAKYGTPKLRLLKGEPGALLRPPVPGQRKKPQSVTASATD